MLNALRSSGKIVDFAANALTVVGGCLGLFAISNPETIAAYLDRIDEDVSVISESIPLWPLIDSIEFSFDAPRFAGIELSVSNPKNLVVNDFSANVGFHFRQRTVEVELNGPELLPPNEDVVFSKNIIREAWFPGLEKNRSSEVSVCLAGRLEGDDEIFYEGRLYRASINDSSMSLLERDFSLGDNSACDL